MNIKHLKYALEVAKTGSINKAAENLYIDQPNLSRAIKELEADLNITIFERSSKGIIVTAEGERLLQYSRIILKELDEMEEMFKENKTNKQNFSISVPRAAYISYAFANFTKFISKDSPAEVFYNETNSSHTLDNILSSDYKLGILRYAERYNAHFKETFDEKDLESRLVTEFSYVLIMSKDSKLAKMDRISFDDLANYIEITHADPFVPSLPLSKIKKEELPDTIDKRIFVFERGSQLDILSSNPDTYMWVSPISDTTLEQYGLIQRKCFENTKIYRDVLVYRKNYTLTDLDRLFIEELYKSVNEYIK